MKTAFLVIVGLVLVGIGQCTDDDLCSTPKLTVGNFKCGKIAGKSKITNAPLVTFPNADESMTYLLLMYDPDAPSTPSHKGVFLHWMLSNIKGKNLKTGTIKGDVNIEYQAPSPPPGQNHRYIFVLYKQPNSKLQNLPKSRLSFNVNNFVASNKLQKVAQTFYKYKSPN